MAVNRRRGEVAAILDGRERRLCLTLGALASNYGREWLERASKSVGGGMMIVAVVAIAVFVIVIKIRSARRAKKDAEDIETEIRLSGRSKAVPENAE